MSLPCTRAEAEGIAADISPLAALDPPPALMTSETDPAAPEQWRLDAYFETRPSRAAIAMLRDLIPSARGAESKVERVAEQDWAALSQQAIAPIEAGRFYVHTAANAREIPSDRIVFRIEASRAFGTGAHETTRSCLIMLDRVKRRGARFANICDLGTGTGLLAFAALALWPRARAIASDIDPVAIEIARENMAANAIAEGTGPGRLELVVAAGMAHRRLMTRAPFDLITANILARPLIALAPAISNAAAPGGTLILAGLLTNQSQAVAAAYRRQRMRLTASLDDGDWAILRMVKRR